MRTSEHENQTQHIGESESNLEPERKRARQTENENEMTGSTEKPNSERTNQTSTDSDKMADGETNKESEKVNQTAPDADKMTDGETETKKSDMQKNDKVETKPQESTFIQPMEVQKVVDFEKTIVKQQVQKQEQEKQPQKQQEEKESQTSLSTTEKIPQKDLMAEHCGGNNKSKTPDWTETQKTIVKQLFLETVDQEERRYARLVAFGTTLALLKTQPLVCGREKKDDDPNFLAIGDITNHKRAVSRKHFAITYDPDVKMFFIEVMSQNGLVLDAKLFLDGKHPLYDNSVITVQSFTMTFVAPKGFIPPTVSNITNRLSHT